ncbi:MAG: ribosome silencing factor [Phycisphaerae bacterium]
MAATVDFGYPGIVQNRSVLQFVIELARIAQDNKSEDVIALDLRGISPVTDFVIICTGTSDRQMRAVVDKIIEYGKKVGERPYGSSGYESAAWILLDYVDVVFHVFSRPYREYYDLELLWGDAPRIDLARSESA